MWDVVGRHRCRLSSDTLYPRDDRRRELLSERVPRVLPLCVLVSVHDVRSRTALVLVAQRLVHVGGRGDGLLSFRAPLSALGCEMRAFLRVSIGDSLTRIFFPSSLVSTFAFALPLTTLVTCLFPFNSRAYGSLNADDYLIPLFPKRLDVSYPDGAMT